MQAVIFSGEGNRPTISDQYLRRLYASPASELHLGTFVQSATILLSDDLGGVHFDMNGLMMEQQNDTTKVRQAQFAQTLLVSHPIGKVTVSGELWHFTQPLTHGAAVGSLWPASYPVRGNLVIDAGFGHGLRALPPIGRVSPVSPIFFRIGSGAKGTVSIDVQNIRG